MQRNSPECYQRTLKSPKEVHLNKDSFSVDSIASMTANIVFEEKEEKRKLNLIIHHIPESNLVEPQEPHCLF